MIIKDGQYDEATIRNYIHLLKALAADMKTFPDGKGPTEEVLAQAPLIEDWQQSERYSPSLTGTFHYHLLLGDTLPNGITSQLWLLNKDEGWARTFSLYYRLGKPFMR